MITRKLAYKQLVKNKKRTMVSLLGIILSVSLITGVVTVYESVNNFLLESYRPDTFNDSAQTTLFSSVSVIELIIIISSILIIINAFNISANERVRQFGLLKSAGATKEQIHRIVMIEALMLAAAAIPLGIVAGYAIDNIAVGIVNRLLGNQLNGLTSGAEGELHAMFSLSAVFFAGILSLLAILISAWLPARRVSRISAIEAVNLTNEINIKSKKVKTRRFFVGVFDAQTMLAGKFIKRNSGRYRVTITSLVLSIAMFLGGYSFSENMIRARGTINNIEDEFGINVEIVLYGHKNTSLENAVNALSNIKNAQTWLTYTSVYQYNGDIPSIQLHSVDDGRFEQLCSDFSLINGSTETGIGILINSKAQPDEFSKNISISFGNDGVYNLTLIGEMNETLTGVVPLFSEEEAVNAVVPESTFNRYLANGENVMAIIMACAENPASFCTNANEIINQLDGENITYTISDLSEISAYSQQEQNINRLITTFVMAFAIMLSLIAASSAIATISASLSLRSKEFAMLQSIGMTQRNLRRMLYYESLAYGCKALAIGIPIGVSSSWILYNDLSKTFIFNYIFPWKSIIICIVSVIILVSAIIRYCTRRLDNMNIAETIRLEVI